VRVPGKFVVFCALAALLVGSSQARGGTSDSENSALLSALNSIRKQIGLSALEPDAKLNASAGAHSRYRAMNADAGESFHSETRGRQGYSGSDPFERMRSYGYRGAPAAENGIAFFGASGDALEGWLAAPYHRIPLLHPNYRDIGLGFASASDSWFVTANFGYGVTPEISDRPAVICYPANGQTNVPTAWTQPEAPDPLRLYHASRPAGYVVSFSYYGGYEPQVRLADSSLETADGTEVECYVNHPGNDSFLSRNSVLLIPKRPLLSGQAYRAHVRLNVSGGSMVERTWTFTTEGGRSDDLRRASAKRSNTAASQR
jgi:uncharacterized protein YkwD